VFYGRLKNAVGDIFSKDNVARPMADAVACTRAIAPSLQRARYFVNPSTALRRLRRNEVSVLNRSQLRLLYNETINSISAHAHAHAVDDLLRGLFSISISRAFDSASRI
jgi:hypothetical protein